MFTLRDFGFPVTVDRAVTEEGDQFQLVFCFKQRLTAEQRRAVDKLVISWTEDVVVLCLVYGVYCSEMGEHGYEKAYTISTGGNRPGLKPHLECLIADINRVVPLKSVVIKPE